MFKPVEMCKINVLVLNKHLTDITRKLGGKGSLHLVDAVAQSESHLLNSVDDEHEKTVLHQLLDKADSMIRKLGVDENSEEYKSCMEELLPLFMEVANSISIGDKGGNL